MPNINFYTQDELYICVRMYLYSHNILFMYYAGIMGIKWTLMGFNDSENCIVVQYLL